MVLSAYERRCCTQHYVLEGRRHRLFALKAEREYQENPAQAALTRFTLYQLQKDEDFGIFYFIPKANELSKGLYDNSDCALKEELGLSIKGISGSLQCRVQH